MKKCAFISMLVLLFVVQERAEAVTVRSCGVKVGVVRASQSWDYSSEITAWDKKRTGFAGGLFVEWLDAPIVSVVTEVEYVQKGAKEEFQRTGDGGPAVIGTFTQTLKFDYVSIPVLLKVRYGLSFGSVYGLAGPRYDILVGTSGDSAVAGVLNDVKSADYGITLGVGIELASLLTKRLGAEFRYSPSIKKVYSTHQLEIKNSSLELKLVVGF